jgi:hypothetical protein
MLLWSNDAFTWSSLGLHWVDSASFSSSGTALCLQCPQLLLVAHAHVVPPVISWFIIQYGNSVTSSATSSLDYVGAGMIFTACTSMKNATKPFDIQPQPPYLDASSYELAPEPISSTAGYAPPGPNHLTIVIPEGPSPSQSSSSTEATSSSIIFRDTVASTRVRDAALSRHTTGEYKFDCDICGDMFTRSQNLKCTCRSCAKGSYHSCTLQTI